MLHLVPQGGGEVGWESTGPRKPTCHRMGTQIIRMARTVAAAGVAGLVASRPRRTAAVMLGCGARQWAAASRVSESSASKDGERDCRDHYAAPLLPEASAGNSLPSGRHRSLVLPLTDPIPRIDYRSHPMPSSTALLPAHSRAASS